MTSETKQGRSLRESEREVLDAGRAGTRRRLEQRLQEEADRQGGVFPPQRTQGTSPAQAVHEPAHGRRSAPAGGVAPPRSTGSALGLSASRKVGLAGPPAKESRTGGETGLQRRRWRARMPRRPGWRRTGVVRRTIRCSMPWCSGWAGRPQRRGRSHSSQRPKSANPNGGPRSWPC